MAVQMTEAQFNEAMAKASPDVRARNMRVVNAAERPVQPLMPKPKPKPPPTRVERVRGHIQRVAAATPRPIRQHAIRHGTTIAGWFAGLTALGIAYAVLMNPNLIVVPLKLLSAAVGAILTMVRSVVAVPTGKTGSAAGVQPGWGA